MQRSGARVRTAATLCAVVAVGMVLAAVNDRALGGGDRALPETGVTVIEGAPAFHFDNLAEMVATSTTVVRGTVVDAARGTAFNDGEVRYTRRLLTIDVEQTLAGQPAGRRVEVETAGWQQVDDQAETELRFADDAAVAKGDRGVFFLYDFEHNGRFGFVADQGVLLSDGTELQDTPRTDPLVGGLEELTTPELEALVVEAGYAASQGLVAPRAYPGEEEG